MVFCIYFKSFKESHETNSSKHLKQLLSKAVLHFALLGDHQLSYLFSLSDMCWELYGILLTKLFHDNNNFKFKTID